MGGRGASGKSQRKTKSESKLSDVVSDIIHGGNSNTTNDNYQIQNNLKDAEKSIMKEPVEHMYIFDENGNRLYYKSSGNRTKVSVSKEEGKLMKNAIVTHNHSSGYAFSYRDIETFIKYDAKELRVVTPEGKVFRLIKTKSAVNSIILPLEAQMTAETIKKKSIRICNRIKNHYNEDIATKKISTINEAGPKIYNNWLKNNVLRYGYEFKISKIS